MAADFKALGKFEQGALAAGALSLIISLFPSYIRVSVDGGKEVPGLNFSSGTSAWTSYATLGMLLILVATAIVAVKAFARESLPAGVPWTIAALAAAGLGTLLVILRALTAGDSGLPGVNVGPGWSGWILFATAIALTVFTFLSFRDSGEKLPEMNKNSTKSSAGDNTPSSNSGYTPPPAGGTTPPAGGTTPPAGGTTPPAGGTTPPPAGGGIPPRDSDNPPPVI